MKRTPVKVMKAICPEHGHCYSTDEPQVVAVDRAHTLIVKFGADTVEDLASGLRQMAIDLERGDLTVGCSGSLSVGSIYSYRVQPEQTHDKYFQELNEMLEREALAKSAT